MTPPELGSIFAPGAGAVVGVEVPDEDPPPPHAPSVRAKTAKPAATAALLMLKVSAGNGRNLRPWPSTP
jgi:hypothetical protein